MRGVRLPMTSRSLFGGSGGGSSGPSTRSTSPINAPTMPAGSFAFVSSPAISAPFSRARLRARLGKLRRGERRLEDLGVRPAAAEVAARRRAHVVERGARGARQEGGAAHDHARRAEPALHGVVLDEGGLYR